MVRADALWLSHTFMSEKLRTFTWQTNLEVHLSFEPVGTPLLRLFIKLILATPFSVLRNFLFNSLISRF